MPSGDELPFGHDLANQFRRYLGAMTGSANLVSVGSVPGGLVLGHFDLSILRGMHALPRREQTQKARAAGATGYAN